MTVGLIAILILILLLPLTFKRVEDNLELFLFIMGIAAVIVSKSISLHFFLEILKNNFLYMITFAVLIGGFLFKYLNEYIQKAVESILIYVPLKIFILGMIIFIGLISSVITAIIAALILVEIIEKLPVSRKNKVRINIISCFSIGLGSILTPIGEPLATIVATKLNLNFQYMITHLGIYVIPAVILLGVLGSFYGTKCRDFSENENIESEQQSNKEIILKAIKIFIFIIALDMLGAGFRPLVDTYVIQLDSSILYWINMLSAVLDNATLAAAEISSKMTTMQINSILIGLLVSGGMMVPGNIPNIISAGKLKIKSSEWMKFGVPLGLSIMVIYYIILFIV